MSKYDEERFMYDLKELLVLGLPAKITELNIEKADNITLFPVDSSNFIDNLDDEILNADPVIYYGLAGIETNSNGPSTSRKVGIFFDVIWINDFTQNNLNRKALRYSRAVREIIEANFKKLKHVGDLVVESMTPTDVKLNDDQTYYKIGGIVVTGTMWS